MSEGPLDSEELGRRLNLLLDTIPRDGARATYAMVRDFLAERGVGLSQSRWTYLLAGRAGERVNGGRDLMTGLAAFFEIDPSYLLDRAGPIPEALEQQLELLRQVRMREVRLYATRKLGSVSPETLQEITRILGDAED
jgi:hypothetical protein